MAILPIEILLLADVTPDIDNFAPMYTMSYLQRAFTSFAILLSSICCIGQQLPAFAEDISPLLIGETVPDMALLDISRDSVRLSDLLSVKPTVLIVYRGGWCPFCNRHLGEIGQITDQIHMLGYQIIAVSPDVMSGLREETIEKESVSYQLLADGDGSFCRAMGIAFRAPERYSDRLSERSGGANTGYLPVPALFVINTEGAILFEHISPNYKQRMSAKFLLAVLEGLKE
jgi:peroxiredoxin